MGSQSLFSHRITGPIVHLLLLLLVPMLLNAIEFRVASYNVENLFDDVRNGTEYDDYVPGRHNWTPRMVEKKLDHTAEVVCDLDAEIVALQEVENERILLRLQKRLKRVGCDYRYAAVTHKSTSAIQVALLSKYPIIEKRELRVNYSPYDRNILEVKVKIGENPLLLFVSHWKSKSRSGTESRRVIYAKVLKKRLESLPKESEYIILGDFNSHYDEFRQLQRRLNDTGGKTGINTVLCTSRSGCMLDKQSICCRGEQGLYNLWMELPPAQRWSHKFYGRKGAIDHILLPHSLFDGKKIDYVNHSFSVFKPAYLFTRKGWINSWVYESGKHKGRGYSDHLPIYASFSTEPFVTDRKAEISIGKIEDLYGVEKLSHPLLLPGCSVILKRKDNAVIKQTPDGKAIYLYGSARGLEEGGRYDLTISEVGSYKGLREILRVDKSVRVPSVPIDTYYLDMTKFDPNNPILQNQVFVGIKGIYRNGWLESEGKKIRIYFKNKRWRPSDGSLLLLHYGHLGYYRSPQLVIYERDDFAILSSGQKFK
jgi:endonuclease/exonuclease/phosphatase family metal-dependent hydrolase